MIWEENMNKSIIKLSEKPTINYKKDFESILHRISTTVPHKLIESNTAELMIKLTKLEENHEAELIYLKELINAKNLEGLKLINIEENGKTIKNLIGDNKKDKTALEQSIKEMESGLTNCIKNMED
jgi:predicted transcriptional regulator with HTH domain